MNLFKRRENLGVKISAPFRAIGIVNHPPTSCPYKPDASIVKETGADPGPEYVVEDREGAFFIVCNSCGHAVLGPATRNDALEIAALAERINGGAGSSASPVYNKGVQAVQETAIENLPPFGFLLMSIHPIGNAGERVQVLSGKQRTDPLKSVSYRVRGSIGEGETGSIAFSDPRTYFRMSTPFETDGFLIGGVGRGVTVDRVQFHERELGNVAVYLRDIKFIKLRDLVMTVTLRDGRVLHGGLEIREPSGTRVICRNCLTLITSEREMIPGIMAEKSEVILTNTEATSSAVGTCEIARYG